MAWKRRCKTLCFSFPFLSCRGHFGRSVFPFFSYLSLASSGPVRHTRGSVLGGQRHSWAKGVLCFFDMHNGPKLFSSCRFSFSLYLVVSLSSLLEVCASQDELPCQARWPGTVYYKQTGRHHDRRTRTDSSGDGGCFARLGRTGWLPKDRGFTLDDGGLNGRGSGGGQSQRRGRTFGREWSSWASRVGPCVCRVIRFLGRGRAPGQGKASLDLDQLEGGKRAAWQTGL